MTLPNRPVSPSRPMTRPAPAHRPNADRFARAREAVQQDMRAFAGAETRQRWHEEATKLYLHAIEFHAAGQYGDEWYLTMSEGEDPNLEQTCILSLKANAWRDRLFTSLMDDLAKDPTPIGPLWLRKAVTRGGQEAWDLIEAAF